MGKTASVGVPMHPEIKAGMEVAAKADRRSLSGMIEIALTEWLQRKGYLAPTKPARHTMPPDGLEAAVNGYTMPFNKRRPPARG